MSKKRGLGKGLSALLENVETDITTGTTGQSASRVLGSVAMLPVSVIEANPFQPRSVFDEESLLELVQSIRELGIVQPVTVRKMGGDRFQLISGERRFRAAQIAGLSEIPSYIRVANDQAMLEMALVENIQRKNLDPVEIAISYQRLIEECNLTQEALSRRVGKKRATVTNYLRLLKLPPEVQLALRKNEISMGHARALLSYEDTDRMLRTLDKIREDGWSVRQTEEGGGRTERVAKAPNKTLPPEYTQIKSGLRDRFGSKADLKADERGKGRITIPFASKDELQRILEQLDL